MSSRPFPAPVEIGHLGLKTGNPEKMVAFYQTFLGAKLLLTNDFISVLSWDQEHHRLAIVHTTAAVPRQEHSNGLDHFALKFASVADLVQVYRAAKEAGIKPKMCLNHGVTTSLYYEDPDGNDIEIQIEAYSNPEDVQKHMKNLNPANTKATNFDPDELMRRVEAGESKESLSKAGFIGPRLVSFDVSAGDIAASH